MEDVRSQSWITTKDAAFQLGCTIQHLRWLIRKGSLPATRHGRDWVLDLNAVQRYGTTRYEKSRPKPIEVHEPIQTLFSESDLQAIVNVASVPMRSPFRYPGGKTWLIPYARLWLRSLKRKPDILVEPFAGGGSIALTAGFEGLAERVLMVELDPDISAVWRTCLNGHVKELCTHIASFNCAPANVQAELSKSPATDLERAFQTIVRNRVSRGGILAPGAGLVKEGEAGKGIASRWYPETIIRRIQELNLRSDRFDFQEGDGFCAIERYASEANVALFVDPPYPKAGRRLYRFHDIDHRALFTLLAAAKGPVLITYDHSEEIQSLASEFGFDFELVPMKSTHHERKFELLISRDLSWVPARQAI